MKLATISLMLLLCAMNAGARTEMGISLSPDADAKITVGGCFDTLSLPGYAPVDVTINNNTGQPRQWLFQFSSPGYGMNIVNTMQSTFTVTVENNGTRTTSLLVPTSYSEERRTPLGVRVTGYGVENSGQQMIGGFSSSGKTPTPFVVISESLGTALWSDLSKRLETDGKELVGSTVNPDDLPDDWRGLSGVAGMWLTGDELNHLSAPQRNALQTWVHAGGWLMLCGAAEAPRDFRFPGFGQVRILSPKLDINETRVTIKEELPAYSQVGHFPAPQRFSEVRPNVPLLFCLMGLFAVVVGPVNVFVFARQRRERLFWTTPVISLGVSALLMAMIVMQDGAGGHGLRNAVVYLFPESRNEVLIQEQISRAGLLLGSAFQTRDPVCMQQLVIPTTGPAARGRALQNTGSAYSGEWFTSRAAQAQRIVAVLPTRAEITLLNASDVRAKNAAPVIVSSFADTLDSLVYTDDQSRPWWATGIHTGQKTTLQLMDKPTNGFRDGVSYLTSPSLRLLAKQPGYFRATSPEGRDYVATLNSIHWEDGEVTYIGPVTATP